MARTPFGPTWDPLAAGRHRGRCLLGVRALPGSHLPSGRHSPRVPRRGRWTWLPVASRVRRGAPWPSGGRRNRGEPPVRRPVVDLAEPTRPGPATVNTSVTCGVSANQQVSTDPPPAWRHAAVR